MAILTGTWSIRDIQWNLGVRDLVAVTFNHPQLEVEVLLHTKDNLALEENHPLHAPKECAGGDVDQRRALDRRVTLTQAVNVQPIGPG